MASCPVCRAEIKDDFGLVTCPSCGSQVLLEMEGAAVSMPVDMPPPITQLRENSVLVDELSQVLVADVQTEPEPSTVYVEPPAREIMPASNDMRDIANFANSSVSQGREGLLRFDIFISGIDTSDIRANLRAVLSDGRFLWDVDKILNEVRNGELKIKDVTAVKSSLLVQRLRAIPVEIRWEQYAIHQV